MVPSLIPSLWTGIHGTVGALFEPYGTRLRVHVRLVLSRSDTASAAPGKAPFAKVLYGLRNTERSSGVILR